jgi:hypothetical protein
MFVGKERKVTVRREELLEKLQASLEKHRVDFVNAEELYKKAVIEWLKEALAKAEAGQIVDRDLQYTFSRPFSHVGDFESVIQMIEMSTEGVIELDEDTFKQWVMGKWGWSSQFESASAGLVSYLGSKGIK